MKKKKAKFDKARNTSRRAKQWWIQKTHQWNKDIFVCTGFSAKQMQTAIKRYGAHKWMNDWVASRVEHWQKVIDKDCAFVAMEPVHGAIVMRLRVFEDTWSYWETLIHELSHVCDAMQENLKFDGETEARAYLHEFLFHNVRRKLLGHTKYSVDE